MKFVLMKRSSESLSEKLFSLSLGSSSHNLFLLSVKVAGVETELLIELLLWQLGDFFLKSSLPQKPLKRRQRAFSFAFVSVLGYSGIPSLSDTPKLCF